LGVAYLHAIGNILYYPEQLVKPILLMRNGPTRPLPPVYPKYTIINLIHFHEQTPRNRFAFHTHTYTHTHKLFPRVCPLLIFSPYHNVIMYFLHARSKSKIVFISFFFCTSNFPVCLFVCLFLGKWDLVYCFLWL